MVVLSINISSLSSSSRSWCLVPLFPGFGRPDAEDMDGSCLRDRPTWLVLGVHPVGINHWQCDIVSGWSTCHRWGDSWGGSPADRHCPPRTRWFLQHHVHHKVRNVLFQNWVEDYRRSCPQVIGFHLPSVLLSVIFLYMCAYLFVISFKMLYRVVPAVLLGLVFSLPSLSIQVLFKELIVWPF